MNKTNSIPKQKDVELRPAIGSTVGRGYPNWSAVERAVGHEASLGYPKWPLPKALAEWTTSELDGAIANLTQFLDGGVSIDTIQIGKTEQVEYEAQLDLAFMQRETLQIEQICRAVKQFQAALNVYVLNHENDHSATEADECERARKPIAYQCLRANEHSEWS